MPLLWSSSCYSAPSHVTLLQLLLLCSSSCYSAPVPVTLLQLMLLCFSSCYSAPAHVTLLQLLLLCSSFCYSAPAHVALLQPMLFSLQHISYSAHCSSSWSIVEGRGQCAHAAKPTSYTYVFVFVGSPWLWLPHCAFNHVVPGLHCMPFQPPWE